MLCCGRCSLLLQKFGYTRNSGQFVQVVLYCTRGTCHIYKTTFKVINQLSREWVSGWINLYLFYHQSTLIFNVHLILERSSKVTFWKEYKKIFKILCCHVWNKEKHSIGIGIWKKTRRSSYLCNIFICDLILTFQSANWPLLMFFKF